MHTQQMRPWVGVLTSSTVTYPCWGTHIQHCHVSVRQVVVMDAGDLSLLPTQHLQEGTIASVEHETRRQN